MTQYLVWNPENGDADDGMKIDAVDFEDAAEQWAERDDSDSADYIIVNGNDATVMVKDTRTGEAQRCVVYGETVASYHARVVSETRGGGDG